MSPFHFISVFESERPSQSSYSFLCLCSKFLMSRISKSINCWRFVSSFVNLKFSSQWIARVIRIKLVLSSETVSFHTFIKMVGVSNPGCVNLQKCPWMRNQDYRRLPFVISLKHKKNERQLHVALFLLNYFSNMRIDSIGIVRRHMLPKELDI